jgi:hypothetical protein
VPCLHERTRHFRRVWWFDAPDQIEQTLALALNLPHVIGEPDPVKRRDWLAGQVDDHTLLIIDNATPGDPVVEHLIRLTPNVLVAVETVPDIPVGQPRGQRVVTLRRCSGDRRAGAARRRSRGARALLTM